MSHTVSICAFLDGEFVLELVASEPCTRMQAEELLKARLLRLSHARGEGIRYSIKLLEWEGEYGWLAQLGSSEPEPF